VPRIRRNQGVQIDAREVTQSRRPALDVQPAESVRELTSEG
jgi:hypothetical protein